MEVSCTCSADEIKERQTIFKERFKSKFLSKHKKYRNVMTEYGVNMHSDISDYSVNFDKTYEEEVAMVVSETRGSFVQTCQKSTRYNISGLFRQMYHAVRRTKASRIMHKLNDVMDRDLKDTLEDVGAELSVAYEYQLAMVMETTDVVKLADYAVCCVFSYLKQNDSSFQPNTILQAVVETNTKHGYLGDQVIKTRILKRDSLKRTRSQKWRIQDIFKQPGIRLEERKDSSTIGNSQGSAKCRADNGDVNTKLGEGDQVVPCLDSQEETNNDVLDAGCTIAISDENVNSAITDVNSTHKNCKMDATESESGKQYRYFGCFTPYGSACRPEKYGFRAPIHVWDEEIREYRLLDNDRISCLQSHKREVPYSELNIHQQYKPETVCAHANDITKKDGTACNGDGESGNEN